MLAAMIVAPGHNMVLPLMPEFITPQDGAEKQDCERNAAKRWQQAREAVGARVRFFQDLHTITTYVLFPSWHGFMIAVVTGKAPPI
jgi:hypothetical protein